jgi:hypothetical protein
MMLDLGTSDMFDSSSSVRGGVLCSSNDEGGLVAW